MRCYLRLVHVVPFAVMAMSNPSFANMAEWTRNSQPDPEPIQVESNQGTTTQNNNTSPAPVASPRVNSNQRQNIIEPSKPIVPVSKYSAKASPQPTASPLANFSGMGESASLAQFMQQSQAISRQASTEASNLRLTPKAQGALNVYTANLMSVGFDVISGDDPSDSIRNYNQAVGCINSLKDQNLTQIARNALASTIRAVDIRRVVSGAMALGGSTTNQCAIG